MHRFQVSKTRLLAVSIGIVYLWFGTLKFFPGVSPAEKLAQDTINQLLMGLIPPKVSIIMLAVWEVSIGILLVANVLKRPVIIAAIVHMVCTFTPLIFFPDLSFTNNALELTLVGQYIIKNLIILSGLFIICPPGKAVTLQANQATHADIASRAHSE
ncbi:MAG TPA: hypothetical protein PKE06_17855 [Flavilitoribacter sp.]|nr:hypothetical protein [Flavilitoribacter sp.]HMQ90187.1 hypothetical protein [Flavilitoribacter sp.]